MPTGVTPLETRGGGGGGGGGGESDPEGHHQDFGRAQISDGSLKLQHVKKRWSWTEAPLTTQRYNHMLKKVELADIKHSPT